MSIKPITYKGIEYPSFSELCRVHGISYDRCSQRLRAGWSLDDALKTPVTPSGKGVEPVKDHLGKKFSSKTKMCEYWGINYRTFKGRIKRGMTLEEALTTPLNGERKKSKKKVIKMNDLESEDANVDIDEDLHILYLSIIGEIDDYFCY